MNDPRRIASYNRYLQAAREFRRALRLEISNYAKGEKDRERFSLSLTQRALMELRGRDVRFEDPPFSDPDYVEKHARQIEEEVAKGHNSSQRK